MPSIKEAAMQTTLSPDAVAVLRFEIKGYRSKSPERRLPAYRELTDAGIMERVPGSETEYRFTEDGMRHREEILEREAERIERERYEPPDVSHLDVSHLSEAAWGLLRRRIRGDDLAVTPGNLPAYRELAEARIMEPVSGFAAGPESSFRFTYWGWARRDEWIAPPGESP
jgi:hypothetical protein